MQSKGTSATVRRQSVRSRTEHQWAVLRAVHRSHRLIAEGEICHRTDHSWVRPGCRQVRPDLAGARLWSAVEWMAVRKGQPMTPEDRSVLEELDVRAWKYADVDLRRGYYEPSWLDGCLPEDRKCGYRRFISILVAAYRAGAIGVRLSYDEIRTLIGVRSDSTWRRWSAEMEELGLVRILHTWVENKSEHSKRPRCYGKSLYCLGPAVHRHAGVALLEGLEIQGRNGEMTAAWPRKVAVDVRKIARAKRSEQRKELWVRRYAHRKPPFNCSSIVKDLNPTLRLGSETCPANRGMDVLKERVSRDNFKNSDPKSAKAIPKTINQDPLSSKNAHPPPPPLSPDDIRKTEAQVDALIQRLSPESSRHRRPQPYPTPKPIRTTTPNRKPIRGVRDAQNPYRSPQNRDLEQNRAKVIKPEIASTAIPDETGWTKQCANMYSGLMRRLGATFVWMFFTAGTIGLAGCSDDDSPSAEDTETTHGETHGTGTSTGTSGGGTTHGTSGTTGIGSDTGGQSTSTTGADTGSGSSSGTGDPNWDPEEKKCFDDCYAELSANDEERCSMVWEGVSDEQYLNCLDLEVRVNRRGCAMICEICTSDDINGSPCATDCIETLSIEGESICDEHLEDWTDLFVCKGQFRDAAHYTCAVDVCNICEVPY